MRTSMLINGYLVLCVSPHPWHMSWSACCYDKTSHNPAQHCSASFTRPTRKYAISVTYIEIIYQWRTSRLKMCVHRFGHV